MSAICVCNFGMEETDCGSAVQEKSAVPPIPEKIPAASLLPQAQEAVSCASTERFDRAEPDSVTATPLCPRKQTIRRLGRDVRSVPIGDITR